MSSKPNVLVVLSSHAELGNTGKKTGWYLPEFAHPYYVLEPYANLTIASPKGGAAPLDESSIENFKDDPHSAKFLKEKTALWENTELLSKFLGKADEFDAVFYVGGHGPMFDLATDPTSIALIKEFYEKGKIVSAVCHGPAVFVNVNLSNGEHLLEGQEVAGFSDAEEDQAGLTSEMPFSLETELNRKSGGNYVKVDPWQAKVSVARNGKLITGQNPASAEPLGKELLKALGVSA